MTGRETFIGMEILVSLFFFVTLPLVNIAHALRDIRRELAALRHLIANRGGDTSPLC